MTPTYITGMQEKMCTKGRVSCERAGAGRLVVARGPRATAFPGTEASAALKATEDQDQETKICGGPALLCKYTLFYLPSSP